MKKYLLLTILSFYTVVLFAQPCVMDTSVHSIGIYPDTLPSGTVGLAYSTDITFFMPLDTSGYAKNWDGIIATWLPGSEGQGVADVLFGDFAFTGVLPIDWEL